MFAYKSHEDAVPAASLTTPEQYPDNKVHGANMGPIWGRQDPGGPHFGPTNFVIWVGMGIMSILGFRCS